MKKLIYLIVLIVAFGLIVTGCIPVVPPTEQGDLSTLTKIVPPVWVDDDYCGVCTNDGHTWGTDAFDTIQDGVDAVADGGTVYVAAGNYPEQLNIYKYLSIIGESRDSVTINASSFSSGYGISVTANNVTLEYFTLEGPTHAGGYGIHTSGCNNITFENLLVKNSGRSGVDFIGCNIITINNVEAKNNGGVGIAITDSSNVTVSNIITSSNTWAGMAVFTYGLSYPGGCDNIVLTGANYSSLEPGPFYTETGNHGSGADYPITNLNVSNDFQYILRFPISGPHKTAFFPTLIYALSAGAYLVSLGAADAVVNDVITETPLTDYGTYYVGQGMIIQSAINAASPGDTIIVGPGTYNEAITVNKSLTIQSSGTAANTIIDASNALYPPPYMYAVTITANDVTFQGFTVKYNWLYSMKLCGIKLDGASGCTVSDNVGDVGNEAGIYLDNSDNNTISVNDFSNNAVDNGIYLYYSDGNEIVGNDVSSVINGWGNPGIGIFVYYSDNNLIHGNTANSDGKGIYIKLTSHGNKVYENEISGNSRGINLDNAYENEIYNNNAISGNSVGIMVENSPDNEIYGNLITGNSEKGIWLFWGFGTHTRGNNIYNNDITSNNDIGIRLSGTNCHDNPIHYNNISGNINYGINNTTGNMVDATCNWWGNNSGPRGAGPGTGDVVSTNVDYNPWQTRESILLVYTPEPQPMTTVVLEAELSSLSTGISGMDVEFYLSDDTLLGEETTDSDGVAKLELDPYDVEVGVYEVYASTICSLSSTTEFLVVYDPSAGFVTGGGWIDSPAGAYTDNLSLTGKATFGFVSKYKKGATVPTGKTEFQFKAGDLNFHSDSYDWLVIAGDKAKYKGTGTINGAGEYGFMLTATDSDTDLFRIKIQDKSNDEVIYDNKMDSDDTEYDGTELGGGQIIVHKGK